MHTVEKGSDCLEFGPVYSDSRRWVATTVVTDKQGDQFGERAPDFRVALDTRSELPNEKKMHPSNIAPNGPRDLLEFIPPNGHNRSRMNPGVISMFGLNGVLSVRELNRKTYCRQLPPELMDGTEQLFIKAVISQVVNYEGLKEDGTFRSATPGLELNIKPSTQQSDPSRVYELAVTTRLGDLAKYLTFEVGLPISRDMAKLNTRAAA
ncbi:hypothetical protein BJ742DRAFT_828180 [Cladochytrium replicatum]|nr:hypothetical protein BJ742DRAFT_828180 [Cladochytrium replicatum]